MSKSVDVSKTCSFPSPIDAPTVLNRLEIQFLDVNESRAIVIFTGGILNLEGHVGTLTDLERAEITVYDLPPDHDTNSETAAAVDLIETFADQLTAAAATP